MGLYNRNYVNQTQEIGVIRDESALVSFVKTTYKFFAASLLAATIGALIGFEFFGFVTQPSVRLGIFVAEIAAFLGLIFLRKSPVLNVILLFTFTFLTGVALVPLLAFVVVKSGAMAIVQAFGMSTIVFGAMSLFALKTKKDLANMGKMLFVSLIVVLICSLINLFFVQSSPLSLLISGAIVVLFSLFVAYDTQNIVRGLYDDPIQAAVSLYLDFLNIFSALLHLLGVFGSDD